MLKYSQYTEDVIDRAWFDSSNIVYGECDESDTQFKTVRITFKNGSVYQYYDVIVHDWVKFKNADSQGKALNEYFKKQGYKYEKLPEPADLEALEKEYEEKAETDFILKVDSENNTLELLDNQETVKFSMTYPGEEITVDIKKMLESINFNIKLQQ